MKAERLLLACGLLLCSLLAQAAGDRALFWEVTKDNARLFLLGSIHVANDSFYPLREEISAAYEASDRLVVEIAVDRIEPDRYLSLITRLGRYPQGVSVASQVAPETYRRLRQVLRQFGLPEDGMDSVRPGMIAMDLTTIMLVRMGYAPEKGIDLHFINRAREDDKTVVALETLESQLTMFSQLPHADVVLADTLDELEQAEALMRKLERAWRSGDIELLQHMFIEEPERKYEGYRDINEVLLYRRNRDMLSKLQRMLADEGSSFVVIGAAHMLGERGLVELLRDAGFEVERR